MELPLIKSVLVSLTGFDSDEIALQSALLLGGPFDAHLNCLHVRPGPAEYAYGIPRGRAAGVLAADLVPVFQEQDRKRTDGARIAFDLFCRKVDIPAQGHDSQSGVTASWQEKFGSDIDETIASARCHDIAVFGRVPDFTALSRDAIGQIVIDCGRPALIPSQTAPARIGHTIAIAWKNCAEAARAVGAASPLIENARNVFVIYGLEREGGHEAVRDSAEALSAELRRHGPPVETRIVEAHDHSAADRVFEAALALDADLLVMGAYSRRRLREMVFGGFTDSVLRDAPIPVLMFH